MNILNTPSDTAQKNPKKPTAPGKHFITTLGFTGAMSTKQAQSVIGKSPRYTRTIMARLESKEAIKLTGSLTAQQGGRPTNIWSLPAKPKTAVTDALLLSGYLVERTDALPLSQEIAADILPELFEPWPLPSHLPVLIYPSDPLTVVLPASSLDAATEFLTHAPALDSSIDWVVTAPAHLVTDVEAILFQQVSLTDPFVTTRRPLRAWQETLMVLQPHQLKYRQLMELAISNNSHNPEDFSLVPLVMPPENRFASIFPVDLYRIQFDPQPCESAP
ncbi:MAG: hypothetical protein AAF485_30630 [Chloroflexota bacterium]